MGISQCKYVPPVAGNQLDLGVIGNGFPCLSLYDVTSYFTELNSEEDSSPMSGTAFSITMSICTKHINSPKYKYCICVCV